MSGDPRGYSSTGSPAAEERKQPNKEPEQERPPSSYLWPKGGPQQKPETRTKTESKEANIIK